ncbi:MAG: class I SAM-dependent rRNA methyltransferase, partial [Verrucomicrobia bacterium]|nr:class I SAM-dependent rRNA methyltransferase [Verrucomicrobiota bacterium]
MAGLIIQPRARLFHGHDWVYSTEVLKTFGAPQDGEIVSLKDGRDRMLGTAIYNSRSQIVARRFSRQRQELDLDFFKRRIQLAMEYRRRHGLAERLGRLVWSESDGLPGVVVDRYEENLVVQTLTLAMDKRKDLLVQALVEVLHPRSIIERNDTPIRKAEGMELVSGVLYGEEPEPGIITADGLKFEVNLLTGQKTGFYLDQLANYRAVAGYAGGRSVLDCFTNQGAFALSCAKAGARDVTAVDISAGAVELAQRNALANNLEIKALEANVFDYLHEQEKAAATYDLVILDPPSFTKSKGKIKDALRGYKEIHLRAMKLLKPDGLLATFCCSHHMTHDLFMGVINEAAVDAKRTLRILQTFSQGLDHPIISTI